ncbi:MAG: AAA family ATPase [bacterium]|nr:AAA family ATPase [bacterium]
MTIYNGHKARVDHRSYEERGIDLLPQPKMRKGVLEMEKRAGFEYRLDSPEAFFHRFKTRMGQDWQDKKIQNMFKVMTQPETVIQNVASSQSTFVWRDIKQEVSQRIPDQHMASYVCDKIQTSSALVNVGEHSFFEGTKDTKSVPVFTSRETLEKEFDLGLLGEQLAQRARHPVNQEFFEEHVKQADQDIKKEHKTGLSDDQKEALSHVCSDSDLSCLVGYAGAGKTTVLGVAKKIWTDSGYGVHGLAPTGRAADNLVDSGITSSQTLHKFLKQFDRGSCHYNSTSVLVLDEGGMVPVHLMKQFLHAVNHLGVKAVVVGDGNQLQPIEAGAAFRSVLRTTNPVSLETVVRQEEDWQREASQNFGAGRAHEALSAYAEKGHLHLKSSLPSLTDIEADLTSKKAEIKDQAEVDLYRLRDTTKMLKGISFGQMLDDVEHFTGKRDWRGVFNHQDFETRYTEGWKALETQCCEVLSHHGFDPKAPTYRILRKHGLEDQERRHDVRAGARAEILKIFRQDFKARQGQVSPDEKTLMFSYSRKDVQALNVGARAFLQKAGVVEKREFTYEVTSPYSDIFGRQREEVLKRSFAKGDLIVFLKNDNSLEIRNGHRGRIIHVDANKIQVEVLGKTPRTVSFATNLYNAIDYGWATTIHKTQGSTLERTLYLASPSDSRNLAYVAMTRHQKDVQVFGSQEEFGNAQTLVAQLFKASEKTLAQDYLKGRDPDLKDPELPLEILSTRFQGLKQFGTFLKGQVKDLVDP